MQKLLSIIFISFLLLLYSPQVGAFWVWTPESGKWLNPKYAAKDTPEEQLKWALEFYDSEDYGRAIKEFNRLIDKFPLSELCAESRYYIGLAYQALEKHYYAYLAYQRIIDDYPQSERIDEIIELEYEIANLFYQKEKASILGKSISLVSSKDKSLEIFQKIIENAPYGKYGDLSQYRIAVYYKDTARYDEAIKEFYKIIDNYPKSELVDDARYEIALCRSKQAAACDYKEEIIDKAIEEFENFLKDYPQTDITDDAKDRLAVLKGKKAEGIFSIAKFYELQGAINSALMYYQEIEDSFPDTSWASKASERIFNINKGQEK